MPLLKIGSKKIGSPNGGIFVIAEIGQNHQGSLDLAKLMIKKAKECGCDCVKFQKSCLSAKFTKAALDRPYQSENSWGRTYGEHKEFLEFSIDQFKELQAFAQQTGILFSASAMDEISLRQLIACDLPFIKIGSGDANNFLLLETAAQSKIPLVISTGMQSSQTVEKIVDIMEKHGKDNYCLLHCVSAYPTRPEDACLKNIKLLKRKFPHLVVGYSGHEEGTLVSKIAVFEGAKVIERHFTLDRSQKGSDHKCSLLPEDLEELVSLIRNYEHLNEMEQRSFAENYESFVKNLSPENGKIIHLALKDIESKEILPSELPCRNKLGKSVVYSRCLSKGHEIPIEDLWVKVSHPQGLSAEKIFECVGKQLERNVSADEPLFQEHLQ